MTETISSNRVVMRETLNVTMDDQTKKLTKWDDALEAMVVTLKAKTEATMV